MGIASIAIWSKKKIVVAIATGVWMANVVSQIQGKALPPFCQKFRDLVPTCHDTSRRAVNIRPDLYLVPSGLILP